MLCEKEKKRKLFYVKYNYDSFFLFDQKYIYMNGIFDIKLYMNMNIFFKYLYLLLFYLYKKENIILI